MWFFSFFAVTFLLVQPAKKDTIPTFPGEWCGTWEGTLHIIRHTDTINAIPMSLLIQPLDTPGVYDWRIQYGQAPDGTRPYQLRSIDPTSGTYAIDEKNGILLPAFLTSNVLTSAFDVEGNIIIATYAHEDDRIIMEILVLSTVKKSTTEGVQKEIPLVTSYPVTGYQRAVLRRHR